MNIEYELKFAATPEVLEAVKRDLGGEWTRFDMRTTYYDAPGGGLSARKWTLRRRMENGVSVCTLKTPAPEGRREYDVVCDSIEKGIAELCKLGAPEELLSLTKDGVREVCGAAFTRYAKRIELPGGAAEVALDSGELFAGGNRQPLCELEVERKEGEPAWTAAYAGHLAQSYGLKLENKSKFKRALALAR